MLENQVSGLPVVQDDRAVGIVTESDIFRLVVSAWAEDGESVRRKRPEPAAYNITSARRIAPNPTGRGCQLTLRSCAPPGGGRSREQVGHCVEALAVKPRAQPQSLSGTVSSAARTASIAT